MADIALLTWKPDRCPRCGHRLKIHPDDWAAGSTIGCPEFDCGILIARVTEQHAVMASCASGGDLPLVTSV